MIESVGLSQIKSSRDVVVFCQSVPKLYFQFLGNVLQISGCPVSGDKCYHSNVISFLALFTRRIRHNSNDVPGDQYQSIPMLDSLDVTEQKMYSYQLPTSDLRPSLNPFLGAMRTTAGLTVFLSRSPSVWPPPSRATRTGWTTGRRWTTSRGSPTPSTTGWTTTGTEREKTTPVVLSD